MLMISHLSSSVSFLPLFFLPFLLSPFLLFFPYLVSSLFHFLFLSRFSPTSHLLSYFPSLISAYSFLSPFPTLHPFSFSLFLPLLSFLSPFLFFSIKLSFYSYDKNSRKLKKYVLPTRSHFYSKIILAAWFYWKHVTSPFWTGRWSVYLINREHASDKNQNYGWQTVN